MAWFAAHMIECAEVGEGENAVYYGYENIVLIEADTPQYALEMAKKLGEKIHSPSTVFIDGKEAISRFYGVRKVVLCQHLDEDEIRDENAHPITGTEITYTEFTITGKTRLKDFVNGEQVDLTIVN
jgi:hypothetical protein